MIERMSGRMLRAGFLPPPELVFVCKEMDRDSYIYAPFGVHYILRLWNNRWAPVAWLVDRGVLQVMEDGGYYKDCRLSPLRFWFRGLAPPWLWPNLGPFVTRQYLDTYIFNQPRR